MTDEQLIQIGIIAKHNFDIPSGEHSGFSDIALSYVSNKIARFQCEIDTGGYRRPRFTSEYTGDNRLETEEVVMKTFDILGEYGGTSRVRIGYGEKSRTLFVGESIL